MLLLRVWFCEVADSGGLWVVPGSVEGPGSGLVLWRVLVQACLLNLLRMLYCIEVRVTHEKDYLNCVPIKNIVTLMGWQLYNIVHLVNVTATYTCQ